MKKRILGIVLCLVMVVSLLPIQAIADESSECANCNHPHYGDYVCSSCGLCSSECSNSDCWYETHCKNCGGCYMSADDWCDECGWCDDCMQEAHCLDCKRCFVGDSKDELCGDCQRCTDCVEDNFVCEECNKCVDCGDDYEHCQSCHKHLEGGEVCGYCDECAMEEGLHCEECGKCFETEVDHCPIHEDDTHCEECAGDYCEECGECEYTNPDLALCDFCGLCKDCCGEVSMSEGCSTGEVCVENGEWDSHFCRDCGECFCVKDKCSQCNRCTDCCKDAGGCTGCDCGEATSTAHKHKYDESKWVVDQTNHWNECRICHEAVNTAPHKDEDGDGKCDTCQCDPTKLLYIRKQPKSVTRKVSDEDLDETDPNHPYNNRAVFSVEARDMVGGRTLSYQWYVVKSDKKTGQVYDKKELPGEWWVKNEDTTSATLDIGVPIDGCTYKYEFYCRVTATAADGSKDTVDSDPVELRMTHNYSDLTCSDKPRTVTITYDDGYGTSGYEDYKQGSVYHNQTCIGHKCGRTKLPKDVEHTFEFVKYLGGGYYKNSSAYKYFYLVKCTDCDYVELKETTSEQKVPHTITLDAPKGSYAAYEDNDRATTNALPGTRLYAYAPYVSGGKVFKEWVVMGGYGAASIDLKNDTDQPGWCTFEMSDFDVTLRAVYDDSKVPVETIKIKEGNTPITGRTITVRVGDTFTVDSILNPSENIVDNRVQWCVLEYNYTSPQVVFDASCADISTLSKPMTGPVKLEAKEVGTVRLRATAYASVQGGERVSDFVFVNVVAAGTHITHDYKVTTVQPTCTQQGYTLYKCTDTHCGHVYKTNIIDPIGHKDENGDGRCDACGLKMGVTGRTKIDRVSLSVTAPAKGVKPTNATTADTRYTVANTQWMAADNTALDPNEPFAPGTVYTVKVTLEAKEGYAFQVKDFIKQGILEPAAVAKATKFQINSVDVVPGNGSSRDSVNLFYTFTATDKDNPVAAYSLTTQVNGGHGTISASKSGLTAGSTETVIFTPDSGYEIDTVTVNGVVTGVISNVLDVIMDADKTIIVTYKASGSGGHTHIYDSKWKNDAANHWHECSCGAKSEEAAHTASDWITDTVATATTDGTKHKECTVCHRVLETEIIQATGDGDHTHNYSADWKSDSINHWKECSCGDKDDVAEHSFKWVVDKEATETQNGSKHEECTVCGYKKTAVDISAIGSTTTKPTDSSQTSSNTGADSPKTSDNSNMILWIATLLASILGVTGTVVYSKRKKHAK